MVPTTSVSLPTVSVYSKGILYHQSHFAGCTVVSSLGQFESSEMRKSFKCASTYLYSDILGSNWIRTCYKSGYAIRARHFRLHLRDLRGAETLVSNVANVATNTKQYLNPPLSSSSPQFEQSIVGAVWRCRAQYRYN